MTDKAYAYTIQNKDVLQLQNKLFKAAVKLKRN